jgi:leucyl aminopeptidase
MNIFARNIPEEHIKADILILPFFEDFSPNVYSDLDLIANGILSKIIKNKDFAGRLGQTLMITAGNINSLRLLLVGLGKKETISHEKIRQAGSKAFLEVKDLGLADVALSTKIFEHIPKSVCLSQKPAFYFLEGGLLGIYRFNKYRTAENNGKSQKEISSVTVLDGDKAFSFKWLQTLASAVYLARDLVNTPANDMTPTALAKLSKELAGKRVKVKVLERKDIEKEKMGAYISVTKGSDEPLKFIIIEYKGGKGQPIVLIGKSVTFDSGGLDIKPGEGMERMKYDMAGGAAVLAVMKAIAEMNMNINVVGILPAVENLISGSASRPGDVVKTITGKTVEIISTDAEGRLTLADAVGYAIKYIKPKAIVDIATLTGACSMAFGNEAIAMMGNDAGIMERLRAASEEAYERAWPMPLFDEYGDYLKSDIADIKNVGGRKGALSSSACFLREFVGETPWVHLDIAGAAWNDKDRPYSPKGASGVGVRLLLNFLKES